MMGESNQVLSLVLESIKNLDSKQDHMTEKLIELNYKVQEFEEKFMTKAICDSYRCALSRKPEDKGKEAKPASSWILNFILDPRLTSGKLLIILLVLLMILGFSLSWFTGQQVESILSKALTATNKTIVVPRK